MSQDPRITLAQGPMTRAQTLVIVICVALTALDGFDVLAISFAAPGIAREWGIDRAALGVVLSMELFGMALGSILIGHLADHAGRRRTILGCVVSMACGMALAALAPNVFWLSAWRAVTGLGIGGLLATSSAVAAEFSSERLRDLGVCLMAVGYPLGVIAGGSVVSVLLRYTSWHAIFGFGAVMTAMFIPAVFLYLPESVVWLCRQQPPAALERINHSLSQLGLSPMERLPPPAPVARAGLRPGIFRAGLARVSVLLTLTYFLHIMSFYFLMKWVPKIVVDVGFAPAEAARVLVWTNIGGASGGLLLSFLTRRVEVRTLTMLLLAASAVVLASLGWSPADLGRLTLICAIAGFCTNGAIVGMYAVLARTYPVELRAGGTGFAIGIGRGGAALGPIIAGILFQAGYALQSVCLLMGAGSLIAAMLLSQVRVASTAVVSQASAT